MKEDVDTRAEQEEPVPRVEPRGRAEREAAVKREIEVEPDAGAEPDARAEPPPRAEPAARAEAGPEAERAGLFEGDRASELRTRWSDIQGRFVDDPREAVKAADALVEEVMRDLTALFAAERSGLETQWEREREVSTEDLRVALRRYRSFFERLLSI